jgi:membrane-associated phospholipid phosphatase
MAILTVKPTNLDVIVANNIAARTSPLAETVANALTWGADEHILTILALGGWILARREGPERRLASDHILLTTLVASALPHLLKRVFDQERPDRRTVRGHWRGVPFSGKRLDAFPSGHAVHIGALASAATLLPPKVRNAAWALGLALVSTRIALLAHWTSDVVVGVGAGILTERALRWLTGYGRRALKSADWAPGKVIMGSCGLN